MEQPLNILELFGHSALRLETFLSMHTAIISDEGEINSFVTKFNSTTKKYVDAVLRIKRPLAMREDIDDLINTLLGLEFDINVLLKLHCKTQTLFQRLFLLGTAEQFGYFLRSISAQHLPRLISHTITKTINEHCEHAHIKQNIQVLLKHYPSEFVRAVTINGNGVKILEYINVIA